MSFYSSKFFGTVESVLGFLNHRYASLFSRINISKLIKSPIPKRICKQKLPEIFSTNSKTFTA
ncbi:MAG: hypothetical protein A2V66_17455 [Ignavibacteria bacterium RBG_13_36_8]|nr:MAG: hypothetical protein A2V66_17455 [Ignavibacteria bacterium RBG_13_36_8]